MNKISKEEIHEYLDSVSKLVFKKKYQELNNSQRIRLRVNLIARRTSDDLDDTTFKTIYDYIEVI